MERTCLTTAGDGFVVVVCLVVSQKQKPLGVEPIGLLWGEGKDDDDKTNGCGDQQPASQLDDLLTARERWWCWCWWSWW